MNATKRRVDRLEAAALDERALDAAIEAELERVGPVTARRVMRQIAAEYGYPWSDDDDEQSD